MNAGSKAATAATCRRSPCLVFGLGLCRASVLEGVELAAGGDQRLLELVQCRAQDASSCRIDRSCASARLTRLPTTL
jgi:hypothetical protein